MTTCIEQFCDWAVQFDVESQLDGAGINKIRLLLLDAVGCGLAGSRTLWPEVIRQFFSEWDHASGALLWGTSQRAHPLNATIANSTAVHGLEFDDCHELGLHLGSVLAPVALALGDVADAGAHEVLNAISVGAAAMIWLRTAMGHKAIVNGWNGTGYTATVGAAACAGKLLKLDAEALASALAISAIELGGLQGAQFGLSKRYITARPAQGGIMAAFLAGRGLKGFSGIFESPNGGLFSALPHDGTIKEVEQRFRSLVGTQSWVAGIGFKPYPASRGQHTALDLITQLVHDGTIGTSDIRSVEIGLHGMNMRYRRELFAHELGSALHDPHFSVALVLLDGSVGVGDLTEEHVQSQRVQDMMKRVSLFEDSELTGFGPDARWGASIKVQATDGSVITRGPKIFPHGSSAEPMTSDELTAKFRTNSVGVLSADQIEAIVSYCRGPLDVPCRTLVASLETTN